jgi:hypothetical protein
MRELIEALTIFAKYAPDETHPTHCEHDELFITCVNLEDVSPEDLSRLRTLGFIPNREGGFSSFRFGSS